MKVTVPSTFLAKCPEADRRKWKTVKDIVATANTNEARLKSCATQIDAIRQWNAGDNSK
jgi:hypothetical protein